jgi:hypothetical protein
MKSGKAAIDERERKKMMRCLRRIVPVPSFFQIFGKSFTSS